MARNEPLRRYLTVQRRTDAQIKRDLERAARDARAQIKRLPNSMRKAQLERTLAAITRVQANLWTDDITGAIVRGRSEAIAAAETAVDELTHQLYARLPERAATVIERGVRASSFEGMVTEQARVPRTLSTRVTGNSQLQQRKIQQIIRSGLTRKLSAEEMARELYRYISPTVSGGASYAAMRLARTEINNAFHERQIENGRRPGVEAITWNLSGSHKVPDECNVLDGKHFQPDDVPNKPHPNCFCFLTYDMADLDDLLAQIQNGDLDSLLFESEVMALEDDPATAKIKIDHKGHNHPATPAARGRCRAHGGTTARGWPAHADEPAGPAVVPKSEPEKLVAIPDPPEDRVLVVGKTAGEREEEGDDWLHPDLHPEIARLAERAYDATNALVPHEASYRIRTVSPYNRKTTTKNFHKTMDEGAFASCSGGHIVVQPELHRRGNAVFNARERGFFIKHRDKNTDGALSTLAHEMGHALTHNRFDKEETNQLLEALFQVMGWGPLPDNIKNMSHFNEKKWELLLDNPLRRAQFVRIFGQYASTNIDEFMAEIWGVYALDPMECDPKVRTIGETIAGIVNTDPAILRQRAEALMKEMRESQQRNIEKAEAEAERKAARRRP